GEGVRAEAQRGAPQSREIWGRLSGRVRGEREQQADGQAGRFHSGRRLDTVRGARDACGLKTPKLRGSGIKRSPACLLQTELLARREQCNRFADAPRASLRTFCDVDLDDKGAAL